MSVATALLLAALFAGDSVWLALGVLAVAGAWGALALAGRAPLPRGGAALLATFVALALWTGLSVTWSIAPDLSWTELNRTLVFTAFLVVGLLLGAAGGRSACRWAAGALVVALGAAVLWALAGKAIPALFPDGGRVARLRDPIGYWNALALAADVLLVLALRLAAAAGAARLVRAGGAILAYASIVAVLLAASRAGVAAAVLGVALWLWLRREERVEAALLAVAVSVPAIAVSVWAFGRPALVEDGQPRADRVADGAWFGLLLVVGAAVVALLALELGRRPLGPAQRRTAGRALARPGGRLRGGRRDRGRGGRGRGRGRDSRGRGNERPRPAGQPQLEQPVRLVGRGARHLRGAAAGRRRGEHVRDRAQAPS